MASRAEQEAQRKLAARRKKDRERKARQRARAEGISPSSVKAKQKAEKAKKAEKARQEAISAAQEAIDKVATEPIKLEDIDILPRNSRTLFISLLSRYYAIAKVMPSEYLFEDGREKAFCDLSPVAQAAATIERDKEGELRIKPPSERARKDAAEFIFRALSFVRQPEEWLEEKSEGGEATVVFENNFIEPPQTEKNAPLAQSAQKSEKKDEKSE